MTVNKRIEVFAKSKRFNNLFEELMTQYFEEQGFSSDKKENMETMRKCKNAFLSYATLVTMADEVYDELRR